MAEHPPQEAPRPPPDPLPTTKPLVHAEPIELPVRATQVWHWLPIVALHIAMQSVLPDPASLWTIPLQAAKQYEALWSIARAA